VKSEFATLLKTPCPPKPETEPQLVELRRQVAEKESGRKQNNESRLIFFFSFIQLFQKELEALRTAGGSDRSVISKGAREVSKLKRQADDLEEELQTAYEKIALAPERQAAEIAKINAEYSEQINEQKVGV